jgi:hypothetical protein
MQARASAARSSAAIAGRARLAPHLRARPQPGKTQAAAAATPPAPAPAAVDAELDALARDLLRLRGASDPSDPSDAAVAEAAAALERRARELGAAPKRAHASPGVFQGHALTGRNVKATSGDLPLGALAFNAYASRPGTLVRIVGGGDAPSRILRGGERFGVGPEAYVLSTGFEVVALPQAAIEGEEPGAAAPAPAPAPPRPIRGFSHAVARGAWAGGSGGDADGQQAPDRMDLQFAAMVLEPAAGTDLPDWLGAFGPPLNAAMEAATGRLVVPLDASKAPKGWIDHLATTPTHTLIRGNFGSVSLLVRVEE